MKKIIICMILSLFSFLIASGSFLINDISAHHRWLETNRDSISVYFRDKDHDKDHKKRDLKQQNRELSQSASVKTEKKNMPDTPAPDKAGENKTANPAQEEQELPEQNAPHSAAL